MIPTTLRIVLSVAIICYFVIILYYLKKRMLDLRYTLIWLAAGICMGIMVFFPRVLLDFVHLLGIESNMNGLFILCFAFIITILMMLTAIVSRFALKVRILIQEISMLEKRIRELESQVNDGKNGN